MKISADRPDRNGWRRSITVCQFATCQQMVTIGLRRVVTSCLSIRVMSAECHNRDGCSLHVAVYLVREISSRSGRIETNIGCLSVVSLPGSLWLRRFLSALKLLFKKPPSYAGEQTPRSWKTPTGFPAALRERSPRSFPKLDLVPGLCSFLPLGEAHRPDSRKRRKSSITLSPS